MKAIKLAMIGMGMLIGLGGNVDALGNKGGFQCPKPSGVNGSKAFVNALLANGYTDPKSKKIYKITSEGRTNAGYFKAEKNKKLELVTKDKNPQWNSNGMKCCYRYTSTLGNQPKFTLNKNCDEGKRSCWCAETE